MSALGRLSADLGAAQPAMGLPLQVVVLMTLLAILPTLVLMMTAFTRIIIVLAILRQAIGLGQMPPNQILVSLSLMLTLFVMTPTWRQVDASAVQPYAAGTIPLETALERGGAHLHRFMLAQTRKTELTTFAGIAKAGPFKTQAEVPFSILLPAFVTSELKTAFEIGFLIYLPFLVIDLIVASVLMALGMMMLSPTIVSLPFKLLLFVLADGWTLTLGSLASSFASG